MMNNYENELSLLKNRKRRKNIIIVVAVTVVVMAIFAMFFNARANERKIKELEEEIERLSDPVAVYEEASREVDIHVINAEIQDIGELATVEYLYTDAGKFEDSAELFGKEIPFSFTTKSFIAKWDGTIKAGVDVSKVEAKIDEEKKEIIVYLPEAEIISHVTDDESIETLNEKDGLFNKIKVEDIREFDAISKGAMEQRVIENGILDKAFDNAKEIIYKLICISGVEKQGYTITFEVIEE